MDKRDIHNREHRLGKAIERINNSKISLGEKKRINKFIDEISIGKNASKKSGSNRIMNYLQFLQVVIIPYFKKNLKKLNDKEVTKFYKDLDKNNIKKKDGGNYANSSKNEIVKTLKKYQRWLHQDNPKNYDKLYRWLKEFSEEKETKALSREEVEKLAKLSDTRDACIFMFWFDSGCRAEEGLNIMKSSLKKPEGKDYYLVDINGTKTKNSKRTISIPIASEYIDAWLREHPQKDEEDFFLFPLSYNALKLMFRKKGKKINRKIYAHLFRHSSATYYAGLLRNTFKLDKRYGWITGSEMSRRYVDRDGIDEEETASIVEQGDYQTISKNNEKLKEQVDLIEESSRMRDVEFREMRKVMEHLAKHITSPTTKVVENVLGEDLIIYEDVTAALKIVKKDDEK